MSGFLRRDDTGIPCGHGSTVLDGTQTCHPLDDVQRSAPARHIGMDSTVHSEIQPGQATEADPHASVERCMDAPVKELTRHHDLGYMVPEE